jgi:hypothetical protein
MCLRGWYFDPLVFRSAGISRWHFHPSGSTKSVLNLQIRKPRAQFRMRLTSTRKSVGDDDEIYFIYSDIKPGNRWVGLIAV